MNIRCLALTSVLLAGVSFTPAVAQSSVEDFYRGRTVEMYVGFDPGASYDLYARLVAQHIGKHIPGNPTVVTVNMPGAGSLLLANWMHQVARKDGSVIGTVSRAAPFEPLIGNNPSANFDPTDFTWLGSANNSVSTCVAWHESGITTFDQLLEQELLIGGDGPTADGEQFARVMNGALGTNIRIVSGYSGGASIVQAMENREVDGRCGWSWSGVVSSNPQWVEDGTISVLVQIGAQKHADLPDVPLLRDLAQTQEQIEIIRLIEARQPLGQPFLAPPGVPEDRAQALRDAFVATIQDPDFLIDAERARLEINPISGEEVTEILRVIYEETPEDVIAKTRALLAAQ